VPYTLYDSGEKKQEHKVSIAAGTVVNNCDPRNEAKVLVRIPMLDQEVWARLSGPGGGAGAGLFYVPREKDEVLVALGADDTGEAYIIGGLWNTKDDPPEKDGTLAPTKRFFRTGTDKDNGHQIEFDDGDGQSVTITSVNGHKIAIERSKIEIVNKSGNTKIVLDLDNQEIAVEAPSTISLTSKGKIAIEATSQLSLKGTTINIEAQGTTTIKGTQVLIN
jgi:uncharacterized protein involved in type VI secretion and phage assembly